MKNKLLFMAGLCYALLSGFLTPLTGQSGSHILSELHDMLDPLDMTEVTSNVLYDRGLDMYHWHYYDGSVPSDSAAFSAGSWSWIYTQASTSFLPGYSTLPASSGYMEHMLERAFSELDFSEVTTAFSRENHLFPPNKQMYYK